MKCIKGLKPTVATETRLYYSSSFDREIVVLTFWRAADRRGGFTWLRCDWILKRPRPKRVIDQNNPCTGAKLALPVANLGVSFSNYREQGTEDGGDIVYSVHIPCRGRLLFYSLFSTCGWSAGHSSLHAAAIYLSCFQQRCRGFLKSPTCFTKDRTSYEGLNMSKNLRHLLKK